MESQQARHHWPEYLIEGACLGLFMISAVLVTALLEHPASPVRGLLPNAATCQALIGIAMGLTAIAIVYSKWGRRSGAHMNPAFTLTFWRLGKIRTHDAAWYVLAQFVGGLAGTLVAALVLTVILRGQAPSYPVTVPGPRGPGAAFLAEATISFIQFSLVLLVSNHPRFARLTGVVAGVMVATYISVEAPLSGMSMNPARSTATAIPSGVFDSLWIYFAAPLLGTLLAAQAYVALMGRASVKCCKLHHTHDTRCIFNCGYCRHAETHASAGVARKPATPALPSTVNT